jgi:DNA-binding winged helix-turn-helix (wHTH) protein
MGLKLSPVLGDRIQADGIPGIELGERDTQDLSSAVALLEDTILSLSGGDTTLPPNSGEWQGSDNYQVALFPLRNEADGVGKNSRAHLAMRPVLVLPLTWRELVARLHAGVGLSGSGRESVVRFGEVCVDFSSMEVSRCEENVPLTTLEFKLLKFLVQNAGRVLSRDEMLNEVWGYENYPGTRTVDNHILRLRQTLELDPAHLVHFHTVHGVGYKFVPKASPAMPEHKM